MSKVEDFLTPNQEEEIIDAIRSAEKDTSGEIRVHIEKCTEKDPLERAKEVFHFLKMDETELHNGVLFYVAVDDKKFSILGDKGIDKLVPETFWDSIRDIVLAKFKKGEYANGLKLGIMEAGNKLKQFFPYQKDDNNELHDSISLG
jgi:uncharacterized membrane protein